MCSFPGLHPGTASGVPTALMTLRSSLQNSSRSRIPLCAIDSTSSHPPGSSQLQLILALREHHGSQVAHFTQIDGQLWEMFPLKLLAAIIRLHDFWCLAYKPPKGENNDNDYNRNLFRWSLLLSLNLRCWRPPAGTNQKSTGLTLFNQTCRLCTIENICAQKLSPILPPCVKHLLICLFTSARRLFWIMVWWKSGIICWGENHFCDKELISSTGLRDILHDFENVFWISGHADQM